MESQTFFLHLLPELENRLFRMRIHPFLYSRWCIVLLCAIAFVILASLLYIKYKTGSDELRQQVNPTFQRAINEELEARFERSNEKFIYSKGTFSVPDHGQKEKESTTKENRNLLIYGDFEQLVKQLHLKEKHPISTDSLNFHFNKVMRRMGMNVHTEVEITNLTTQTTLTSSKSFNKSDYPFYSDPLVIDKRHEIQVQGFVKFPLWVILLHGEWNVSDFLGISMIFLIFTSIGFISSRIHLEKKRKNTKTLRFGNLTFDIMRRRLYSEHEEVEVRAQLTKLIILFLEAPDHILTKEEIKLHFWPKNEYQTDSKIHNLIASLRTICRIDPSIRIESISQKGYQLIW